MTGDPTPCAKCGRPHPRCAGHKKSDGLPCGQPAMRDQAVCKMHGGKAGQALAAARRRREEREAREWTARLGLSRDVDPHTALLEEVHRTAAAVEFFGALAADVPVEELGWGRTREDGDGATREARPNVYVGLWQSERRHLVDVCRAAIGAGIEERRVELEQRRAGLVAVAFGRAVDRVALPVEVRGDLARALVEEMRALAAGSGPGVTGGTS